MSVRDGHAPGQGRDPLRSAPLRALAVLLFAEAAGLAAATVFLVVELFTVTPDSYPSAIAIVVLTALGATWLAITAASTLRGRPWIRGAATTVQLLVIAVAIGAFQGSFARADIGWMLLVPAVAVLVLLFTPRVLAATTRHPDQP